MNFSAFFSYAFLTALTPGPNNIMSMSNAIKNGFIRSFRFNLGVLFGFLIVMSICAAFTSLIYSLIPSVKPVMLCIGATYILWLAWTVWRDKPQGNKTEVKRTASFINGMVLQFINVKVIIYGITTFSAFILPNYRSLIIVTVFVFILSLIGFLGTCCWSLFGAAFDRFFKKHSKIINNIMALFLVYCAVTMILDIWK